MNRKYGIAILIVCFGFSNINIGWAADVVEVSPVVVQPYALQALNQHMLERDRQNRDEEIDIKALIEDNNKLIKSTLASQQDQGLQKVNQLMLHYRNALLSRDQQRIADNSQQPSRYADLIALTQDAQAMRWFESKSTLIEDKYRILNDLKDEMSALNEKLKGQGSQQKDEIIEGFKKVAQQQQDKIQMLVDRLSEMDQKIAHFDEIIAQKDRQIDMLRENLAMARSEVSSKDEIIRELSGQKKPVAYSNASESVETSPIIVQPNMGLPQPQQKPAAYNRVSENVETSPIIVQPNVETSPIIVQPNMILSQPQQKPAFHNRVSENVEISPIVVQPAQAEDLTAKDDTIRWLKEVLAVTKVKAEYFRLMSQQNNASVAPLQGEVQKIKDDFALRLRDFDRYQNIIVSLKDQVGQLGKQLAQKQKQVELLKEENAQAVPSDDRWVLARQLIDLQHQEEALLVEKSRLVLQQYTIFDRHLNAFEDRVKVLLANHRIQAIDFQDKIATLKNDLSQKQQEVDSLKAQLEEKIANQKNQGRLEAQIQDLKTQLKEGQDRISRLKAKIQDSEQTQAQIPDLQARLAAQQDKVVSLKAELENKTAESNKLTAMVDDYQKKLESKNSDYNDQLQQLKDKQADIVKIKENIYALQKHAQEKEKDLQSRELTIFMVQQRMDEKAEEIKALRQELALDRERLQGMPNSDEIDFMKNGVKKAAIQTKALQSLKEQLQDTQEQLQKTQEQLSKSQGVVEDKTKELLRLKYVSNEKMKALQTQVKEVKMPSKGDAVREKLEQALDKIQEQGRMINILSQKLEDAQAQVASMQQK